MPVVLLFIGAAALVTGISALVMHNSVSKSSSTAIPGSDIAEKVNAKKEEINTDLMVMLLKGIMTIAAKIQANEAVNQELLESVSNSTSIATALGTSAIMNVVQDNIAEVQRENSRVNQTTAVNTQDGAYVETFPTTQQQGPQIYDTPAGQIEGPLINVFLWVQPEPQVHVTPKTSIKSEPITGVPADTAKELGDGISWAKSKNKTDTKSNEKNKSNKKVEDEDGSEKDRLPENRRITEETIKKLKRLGLDKKFINAMRKLATRRKDEAGIIILTAKEFLYKNAQKYTYKIKVPSAPNHTRVYGYINEIGELIFDLIWND